MIKKCGVNKEKYTLSLTSDLKKKQAKLQNKGLCHETIDHVTQVNSCCFYNCLESVLSLLLLCSE